MLLNMLLAHSAIIMINKVTQSLATDTSLCLNETDVNWNIMWPITASGEMVIRKCPGGAESLGSHVSTVQFYTFCIVL